MVMVFILNKTCTLNFKGLKAKGFNRTLKGVFSKTDLGKESYYVHYYSAVGFGSPPRPVR